MLEVLYIKRVLAFFKYIKILVSEQRNATCEIALKYHKIWIIRNDKKDYRNIL